MPKILAVYENDDNEVFYVVGYEIGTLLDKLRCNAGYSELSVNEITWYYANEFSVTENISYSCEPVS